ncbi:NAD(P)H-dependent oxidoreductase [Methanospirillum stamsii]|uniref:NAD(P)H dehydrogenase n=1 Tax=Methanospirillum stamsii TaxID=1277351 RepID=A0A2V2N4N8_9EURY|nr:NAD(P)H-dependent oxidoreductase [Methanospirillum stamsii]PWR74789.1 NAD(P)H dehydrogenase [Methanospirillum stamsii]
MVISIILAHPEKGSLNHAIAMTALDTLKNAGHEVIFHDLYKEEFNPILPANEISRDGLRDPEIIKHCEEISRADGIIIVHPNWWGQPPAILKGWIDRVIRPGVAYRFIEGDNGEGVPVGLLPAKSAIVFNTANTPEEREELVFGDPLDRIWRDCVFGLCGVTDVHRRIYRVVVMSDEKKRKDWLLDVQNLVKTVFPEN